MLTMWSRVPIEELYPEEVDVLRHAFKQRVIIGKTLYYRKGMAQFTDVVETVRRYYEPFDSDLECLTRFNDVDTLIVRDAGEVCLSSNPEPCRCNTQKYKALTIVAWAGKKEGLEEFIQSRGKLVQLGDVENPWLRDSDWLLRHAEQLNPYLEYHRWLPDVMGDISDKKIVWSQHYSKEYAEQLRTAYQAWRQQHRGRSYVWRESKSLL